MIEAILVFILIFSFLSLQFKDLIGAVISLAIFSFLCALLFFLLHAPDVAIAEAAVGAGVATVIFVWAIRKTERMEE